MSRVKSSSLYVASGGVTRSQYDKRTQTTSETYTPFSESALVSNLQVPNITNNPLVAGYRKPSSYYLKSVSSSLNGPSNPGIGFYATASGTAIKEYFNSRVTLTADGLIPSQLVTEPAKASYNQLQALRTKIRNNIADEKFDVAMLLAEIGKTASTASGLLHRIGRSMDAIRRKSPESFRYLWTGQLGVDKRRPTDAFLRETAGMYLEWKYGIMPSIYDLEGITQQLDNNSSGASLFDNPPLMTARATVSDTKTQRGTVNVNDPSSVHVVTVDVKTSVTARTDFTVDGMALRGLNHYGLNLTTVATLAYDLTPFSFVFNMAVPMAELIKAWSGLAGVGVKSHCETTYHKYTTKKEDTTFTREGEKLKLQFPSLDFATFERLAMTEVPFPMPYVRNPIKVGNIATVLSLFTTLRSKG